MQTSDSVLKIKGVGSKTAGLLGRLGIETVGDLLRHYPRDYISYEDPIPVSDTSKDNQGPAAYLVRVKARPRQVSGGKKAVTTMRVEQEGGAVTVIWFHSPYIASQLTPGKDYIFYGSLITKGRGRTLQHPEIYAPAEYQKLQSGLQPVYILTKGLTQNFFRKTLRQLLGEAGILPEVLPTRLRQEYQLAEYHFAMQQIHFPDHKENLVTARRRLVFDDFFFFLLMLKLLRKENRTSPNSFPVQDAARVQDFIGQLPYQLTGAQMRVWREIEADLAGSRAMNRLIQGDVGSGKTVIAALAMLAMAFAGHQAALMAPTEVLARQHYEKLSEMFAPLGIQTTLLTGSMSAAQKREVYRQMGAKETDIIIGTQALFQDKASYADLGLIVTDEQHRFGVAQRQKLADKGRGKTPHVLVMSATPIPRTLAIVLYSDLDVSAIEEKPQNRLPVKTAVVDTGYRPKAYRFLEGQVRLGHQVYVICPMVEESEQIDAENVLDYTQKLKDALPADIRIEYVHGKLKAEEKNRIMQRFAGHETDILVSTTVVEVGVDVPNATVIMVENAERFGLAQLHQLRGRVGRGEAQSYCIFIYGQSSPAILERLEILRGSRDGFAIAAADLRLRGPGDMFGTMQSGALQFSIGDVFADSSVLMLAGEAADKLLAEDPALSSPDHADIRDRIRGLQNADIPSIVL